MADNAKAELRQHLEQMVGIKRQILEGRSKDAPHYLGTEDLVLREGTWYEPPNHARPEMMGEVRMCFNNALSAALAYDLTYVEGYAASIIPVHHAWCTDDEGRLYEVTWPDSIGPGTAYLGVSMDKWTVAGICEIKGETGILDDWINGWPAMKQPWNPEGLLGWYRMFSRKERAR